MGRGQRDRNPVSVMKTMSIEQSHPDGVSSAGSTENGSTSGTGGSGSSGWLHILKSTLGMSSGTLRETLEQTLRAGHEDKDSFSPEEREMLLRLLRYGGLRVDDVMVPRADIIAVEESETIANVLKTFVDSGVSRVPVYIDTLDDPRGVIHVKDLIQAIVQESQQAAEARGEETATAEAATADPASQASQPAGGLAAHAGIGSLDLAAVDLNRPVSQLKVRRQALFVPPSMPAMNLLLRMQSTRSHMALVVDEYGGPDGLVTIEDLVEQSVGEIDDEHDEDEADHIVDDPKQGLVCSARTPVEDLEQRLGLKLLSADDEDDIDTLGGLVFSLVGRVPSRGELIPHPTGVEFEVLDADPRRIKKLKVHVTKIARDMQSAVED